MVHPQRLPTGNPSFERSGCQENAPSGEPGFIDEKELLKRLPVSRRTLFSWRMSGQIPFVCLDGRRVIFHWPSVQAALLRRQKGGSQ
jgi:hypothetical protein